MDKTKNPTNVGLDVDLFLRIENRGDIFTPNFLLS
jgi:hypothetical protein